MKVPPPLASHKTIAMLLDGIANYLNTDGAVVEPNAIDSSGMTIIVDNMRFRLELDDGEVMDDSEWRHAHGLDTPFGEWINTPDANGAYIGGNDFDGPDVEF